MKLFKLMALLVVLFITGGCGQSEVKISDTRFAMDTFIKIDAYGTDEAAIKQSTNNALQCMQQIAAQTDRFNDGGAGSLYRLNKAGSGEDFTPAPHLAALLGFYTAQRDNEVDITLGRVSDLWLQGSKTGTVPAEAAIKNALLHSGRNKLNYNAQTNTAVKADAALTLDLGAIAKGYAIDKAADVLQQSKAVSAALINGGGNIKVLGSKADGKPWVIAVQHPRRSDKFLGTVILQPGQAAATSGDYQRYFEAEGKRWHHIISPQTGYPVNLHQSVTVIAPTALEADYNSTLLFLKTDDEIKTYLAQRPQLAAIVVSADGSVWASPNLAQLWQSAED